MQITLNPELFEKHNLAGGGVEIINLPIEEYLREECDLETLDTMNQSLPPMNPECKLCICIPAFQEQLNIYKCLWAYSYQKNVQPEDFEILILANRPQDRAPLNTEMLQEIERFRQDFPSVNVRVAEHTFQFKKVISYGEIYKLVMDLALYRADQALPQSESLAIRASAADALEKHPHFIHRTIDAFLDPEVMGYRSRSSWPREFLRNNPILVALDELEEALLKYPETDKHKKYQMLGAFRASAYAMVGGIDPLCPYAERAHLSESIFDYATDSDYTIFASEHVNAIDNPRRLIATGGKTQHSQDVLGSYRKMKFERQFRGEEYPNFTPDSQVETPQLLRDRINAIFRNFVQKISIHHNGDASKTIEMASSLFCIEMVIIGFQNEDFHIEIQKNPSTGRLTTKLEINNAESFLETIQKRDLSYFDDIPVFQS